MKEVLGRELSQLFTRLPAWQATLLLLGVSIGVAVVLEFVVLKSLLRYTRRTETQYDNILVSELRIPIVLTAALAGVYQLTEFPEVVNNIILSENQLTTFFGNPALSVILLAWAFAANRLVNRFVEEAKSTDYRFDFAPIFSNIWTLVVAVGTVGLLISVWGYSITPLLGAAGVASVTVGFAAKDTVANFFGGIALYFDDTYKLGDYIELSTGESGTVVEVGVRSTTLMTRDEILITVPNAVLNAGKVINQSSPQTRKRIKIPIGIAYGTDIDEFEQLVIEIATEDPYILDTPKPRMRFRRFGDSALQYELFCWVRSPTRDTKARHKLNQTIYKRLTAANIEIPFPQQDINLSVNSGDTESMVANAEHPVHRDGENTAATEYEEPT